MFRIARFHLALRRPLGHLRTIGDDDAPSLSSNELTHGTAQQADLLARPDLYRIGQKPYSSYEVVVDGTSGDIVPVTLQRLAGDNVGVLQTAAPVAVGDTVARGQLIGRVGASGRVTGPHLHWAAFYGRVPFDPVDLLDLRAP